MVEDSTSNDKYTVLWKNTMNSGFYTAKTGLPMWQRSDVTPCDRISATVAFNADNSSRIASFNDAILHCSTCKHAPISFTMDSKLSNCCIINSPSPRAWKLTFTSTKSHHNRSGRSLKTGLTIISLFLPFQVRSIPSHWRITIDHNQIHWLNIAMESLLPGSDGISTRPPSLGALFTIGVAPPWDSRLQSIRTRSGQAWWTIVWRLPMSLWSLHCHAVMTQFMQSHSSLFMFCGTILLYTKWSC